MTAPARRLVEALEPLLATREVDLEDVVVSRAGKRTLVRIVVDKDGGIDLDAIASLTELIGDAVEDSEILGDSPYLLEITSPGVDRPLTLPRHWRRNAARLVKVTTTDGETFEGRIFDADDEAAVIVVGDGTRRITYDEVTRAVVQIEFNKKDAAPDTLVDDDDDLDDEDVFEDEVADDESADDEDEEPAEEV
jgi:ribosome maturation factor RimP